MDKIVGFVDGIAGDFIQGWIANTMRPEKLERIVCRGLRGASLSFRAYMPRLDVCDALS